MRSSKIQTYGEAMGSIDFHSAMPEYKSFAAGVLWSRSGSGGFCSKGTTDLSPGVLTRF
jgi:hypothetical protein